MAGSTSHAAVITLATNQPASATITVDCPSGCEGLVGDPIASLSTTEAWGYRFGRASEAALASNFSTLTGLTVPASAVTKTNGGGENFSFNVGEGWFFVKYGRWTSFLLSYAEQSVTFLKTGRGPAGLSNYGSIAPVPLPAAGWLLIAGLGGLFMVRRRRSA
ncbi:VPLPA-CTERM sorting domain-containing protein [Aliiroseovarius subalbicans]|uniref:VPLPA-CTERM sorting domain-containing protein n=1 Tax=Aliiroseovarius subalbicans TaxID=2925840 RepID=UPI001F5A2648|nr:VPLPA-CTERM sorting domain-containing protein [Aliiroseovarius subalbicans]MCI2401166.1 VPLPA-CTERM sorting domain-containing protein [Aliiroseovarius subalbicans]